jgi:hypothetical protein
VTTPKGSIPSIAVLSQACIEVCATASEALTSAEVDRLVKLRLAISESDALIPHVQGKKRTELAYRLAWARSQATSEGRLARSSDGLWQTKS